MKIDDFVQQRPEFIKNEGNSLIMRLTQEDEEIDPSS